MVLARSTGGSHFDHMTSKLGMMAPWNKPPVISNTLVKSKLWERTGNSGIDKYRNEERIVAQKMTWKLNFNQVINWNNEFYLMTSELHRDEATKKLSQQVCQCKQINDF